MDKNTKTKAWRQYEAGKDYKRKIGFYENVRRNERYYRGDQWYGSQGVNLPKPVFSRYSWSMPFSYPAGPTRKLPSPEIMTITTVCWPKRSTRRPHNDSTAIQNHGILYALLHG